jgi:hypothetical protein
MHCSFCRCVHAYRKMGAAPGEGSSCHTWMEPSESSTYSRRRVKLCMGAFMCFALRGETNKYTLPFKTASIFVYGGIHVFFVCANVFATYVSCCARLRQLTERLRKIRISQQQQIKAVCSQYLIYEMHATKLNKTCKL